jgi:hypothetical protein
MTSNSSSNSSSSLPENIPDSPIADASNIPSVNPTPSTQHEKSTDDDVDISDIELRELYNIARGAYDMKQKP